MHTVCRPSPQHGHPTRPCEHLLAHLHADFLQSLQAVETQASVLTKYRHSLMYPRLVRPLIVQPIVHYHPIVPQSVNYVLCAAHQPEVMTSTLVNSLLEPVDSRMCIMLIHNNTHRRV
ncbi:UNVERIFIED_CONTAM: hypothetical protein Sindi_2600700 [Sesamum indicum]